MQLCVSGGGWCVGVCQGEGEGQGEGSTVTVTQQ